jgi:hypothetical protein
MTLSRLLDTTPAADIGNKRRRDESTSSVPRKRCETNFACRCSLAEMSPAFGNLQMIRR